MERYDNIVKIEEIRRLVENNQYEKAMKVLDTMDIGKIKALTDLSVIGDVYTQNGRYEEAMEVLTKIYGKTKTRRILYQLVDLSIKRGNIPDAEDYLEKYIKAAPQDPSRYIFRYCIDKLNHEPYEILIASLEQLKEFEYYEMWAYELAKLYHKAGMKDKCVRECSDIILWFGDGIYVEKAKLLKGYYVGEINPIHMLKAREKKETEKKLGLDKTKDYSAMRSQIDQFLADEDTSVRQNNVIHLVKESENDPEKRFEEAYVNELNNQEVNEDTESEKEEYDFEINNKVEADPILEVSDHTEEIVDAENNYDMDQNAENNTQYEFKDIKQPVIHSEDKKKELQYIPGKFDSIFSEAGMNYEKDFGYFILMDSCRNQIELCLESILSDYTKTNHMMIIGERKSGKTTLAKKISKALYGLNWINTNRVAKITASKLNGISLEAKMDKLVNSSLIIEEAGLLDAGTAEQLLLLIQNLNKNIFVILEDNEKSMKKLLDKNPKLGEIFSSMIKLPDYSKEDLSGFAFTYIRNNDYEFTREVKTAFEKEIENIFHSIKEEDRLEAVMALAKKAKTSADERNKALLSDVILDRDLSSEDFLYIKNEDFCNYKAPSNRSD